MIIFCLIAQITFTHSQETLIEKGSEWDYYDNGNSPPAQNTFTWKDTDYDATSWKSGRAHMGYGDGDESTIVKGGIRTLYVRRSFEVDDPSLYNRLILNLIFDDGAVIYINGEEVKRLNMPAGDISYITFASSVGDENGEARLDLFEILKTGKNTVAVEIHQESNTSSDISFDFTLSPYKRNYNFTSSALPIIFVETDNNETIVDEPKVNAEMRIIYNEDGSENNIDATDFHFKGRIGIELRGQSSLALFPKKGFGVEVRDEFGDDLNIELLGFPEESDFVIHSPYSDKTLMRNALTYHFGGQIMAYAPRVKMCELIINDNYYGVVLFTEKIKRDKNRVDVNKLKDDEIEGDDLTGGYILKFDKRDIDEVAWISQYRPISGRSNITEFVYHYPKADDIVNEQKTYIRNWITNFERVLKSDDYQDVNEGYRKYIEVNSFIDLIIMNEITRNVDGYRLSTFMYKQKDSDGGKLSMGPIWDYNLALGNADYCDGGETWGWAHQFNRVCPNDTWVNAFWWDRLLNDPAFKQQFKDRYNYFRSDILSNENVMNTIDSLVNQMGPAIDRNFERWPVLGIRIWPNKFIGSDYEDEVEELKRWITERFKWLDENIKALTTDIELISSDSPISIFPNPTSGRLNFSTHDPSKFEKIRIFGLDGRLVFELPFDSTIELKSLNMSGVYVVHVVHQDGTLYMQKVVVE